MINIIANGHAQNLRGGGAVTIQNINVNGVLVPRMVTTVIRTANTDHARSNFGTALAVERRMTEMNRRPGDEKGHIIGICL